jgi:hypothetical protein
MGRGKLMKTEEFKEILLQVIELQLEYQLRAVRQLRGKAETEVALPSRRGRRRQSLVDLSVQILTEEGKPLHVDDLVELLQKRFGRLTDRDALSSSLAKKARAGIIFRQAAPATFALLNLATGEDDHDKA